MNNEGWRIVFRFAAVGFMISVLAVLFMRYATEAVLIFLIYVSPAIWLCRQDGRNIWFDMVTGAALYGLIGLAVLWLRSRVKRRGSATVR